VSEPATSVVVTTRDRLALLRRVLGPVRSDPATAEVVVVDDGSVDGTAGWLGDAARGAGPPLRVLRRERVGPGAARQAGVERTAGQIVVMLDDDVVPRDGLVSAHARLLRSDRSRITVGYSPVSVPVDRRPDDVATFAYARDYERRCARYERGPTPVLHNLWGGNVGLWRDAALQIGLISPPFDEAQTFYEDRDFGLRAMRAGLRAVFDRSLAADHHHRRSPAAALADAERRGRSAVRLHRLHADLIGPYDPGPLRAGLPPSAAACLRLARRGRADRAFAPVALAAVAASGRLGRWEAQDAAFKLARRVREQRGALMACAERRL
jgi:glycosyltransferase involved in cell wall biosynthesis